MDSVTHLAGPAVIFNGRVIQRWPRRRFVRGSQVEWSRWSQASLLDFRCFPWNRSHRRTFVSRWWSVNSSVNCTEEGSVIQDSVLLIAGEAWSCPCGTTCAGSNYDINVGWFEHAKVCSIAAGIRRSIVAQTTVLKYVVADFVDDRSAPFGSDSLRR